MDPSQNPHVFHATTIVSVRRGDKVAIAGDGQVTLGNTVMKANARKVRRLGKDGQVLALLAVADRETSLVISGTGDVIEPDDGVVAIGSGGPYALSAARALAAHTEMDPKSIAVEALKIAGDVCIYTNGNVVVEEL